MQNLDERAMANLADLNLMRVLDVLLQTRSVTRSGELLGLSQPAASRAVARLRDALDDPLLVRTRAGYVLTPLAQSLGPLVQRALSAAQEVFTATHFEPANSTRTFRIATTDYGAQAVLVPLAPAIGQAAPGIHLLVSAWRPHTLADLERGAVDLALYADDPIPDDFHASELFRERYVVIVRNGHPLLAMAGAPMAELLAAAATHRHIVARYPNDHLESSDDLLRRLGAPMGQPAMSLPYFSMAQMIVAGSDLIMALPERLIGPEAGNGRQVVAMPLEAPQEEFGYRVIWHERSHRDPGQAWLRRSIRQRFA